MKTALRYVIQVVCVPCYEIESKRKGENYHHLHNNRIFLYTDILMELKFSRSLFIVQEIHISQQGYKVVFPGD